jgi:ketosteroid isomerase-like protein
MNMTRSDIERRIEEINAEMLDIYNNRDVKTSVMPERYYFLLRQKQDLESKGEEQYVKASSAICG